MIWLIRGLIFGSFVSLAIGLPIAFLTSPSDTIPGSNETKTTSTTSIETTEMSTTKRPTTGTNMPATKTLATAHQDEETTSRTTKPDCVSKELTAWSTLPVPMPVLGSTNSVETIETTTSPCPPIRPQPRHTEMSTRRRVLMSGAGKPWS